MSKKDIAVALGIAVLCGWISSIALRDATDGLKLEGGDALALAGLVALISHVIPKPQPPQA